MPPQYKFNTFWCIHFYFHVILHTPITPWDIWSVWIRTFSLTRFKIIKFWQIPPPLYIIIIFLFPLLAIIFTLFNLPMARQMRRESRSRVSDKGTAIIHQLPSKIHWVICSETAGVDCLHLEQDREMICFSLSPTSLHAPQPWCLIVLVVWTGRAPLESPHGCYRTTRATVGLQDSSPPRHTQNSHLCYRSLSWHDSLSCNAAALFSLPSHESSCHGTR